MLNDSIDLHPMPVHNININELKNSPIVNSMKLNNFWSNWNNTKMLCSDMNGRSREDR